MVQHANCQAFLREARYKLLRRMSESSKTNVRKFKDKYLKNYMLNIIQNNYEGRYAGPFHLNFTHQTTSIQFLMSLFSL